MNPSSVLVEISIPAINQSFDFQLPVGCRLAEVFPLLLTIIIDLSSGNFALNSPSIYHLVEELALSMMTIIDYQLNGAKLFII
ncbi:MULTISPECIES: hypothetical protein [unclassified Enterococcus]|uniref:hypothetical protein n=1 Tax=unclassified Enterococcus TaxID=2608891 RepID=UPI00155365A7|nr:MULTISPECIES: hypothetical protein [unclassified Enterococcus]MBS7576459.1 hypothetical protein [Enterococcus sp. MMGLQ5-2]MBS7583691.1 hypothetical protein [Enterococcus sp. MMGLQ5-1]NPD11552.1 hypothetical protein [Enterococcus sp. MMGLQ5-1]NPD36296.1 hypothetical protein [Enterococcus sp. MMGLQ5-2]